MTASVRGPRRGVTLVELVVVLAIVATVLAVTAVSLSRSNAPTERQTVLATIAQLRSDALRSQKPRRAAIRVAGKMYSVLALPDGSVHAAPQLGIDQLTGRPDETRP